MRALAYKTVHFRLYTCLTQCAAHAGARRVNRMCWCIRVGEKVLLDAVALLIAKLARLHGVRIRVHCVNALHGEILACLELITACGILGYRRNVVAAVIITTGTTPSDAIGYNQRKRTNLMW